MHFQIRSYTDMDFEKIVDLMFSLQNHFAEIDSTQEIKPFSSRTDAVTYVRQAVKDIETRNGASFVAEINGQVVGFIQGIITTYEGDVMHSLGHKESKDGWIGLLFTQSEYRGKGLGQALLNKMKEYFAKNGCLAVKLLVADDNKLAIRVYEKYGFQPTNLEMTLKI